MARRTIAIVPAQTEQYIEVDDTGTGQELLNRTGSMSDEEHLLTEGHERMMRLQPARNRENGLRVSKWGKRGRK